MSKRLQVLIEDAEYGRLQAVARRSGRTLAEWVRDALRTAAREEAAGSSDRMLTEIAHGRDGIEP